MFMVCHKEAEPSVCLTRGITVGRPGAAVSLMTGGWCLKITPCPSPALLATLSSALSPYIPQIAAFPKYTAGRPASPEPRLHSLHSC